MTFIPQTIVILGRQPALGIAELESLYGAESVQPFGKFGCLLSKPAADVDFGRLGGSVRLAKILDTLPNDWSKIEQYLIQETPKHACCTTGKLSFGISAYGTQISPKRLAKTALLVKKAIKSIGRSVRMVPHIALELGSATVIHNKLTENDNWELLVVSDGQVTYLAQTVHIQDIESYTARDRERPYRDAKVGMLPPKLAQIIINLAVSKIDSQRSNVESRKSLLVLDPFCGTGVLLQEATLMNYDVYGSDLEPRMVQYSIDNLAWLDKKYPEVGDYRRVEIGDAATHKWDLSIIKERQLKVVVAGETYLGQPLSALPSNEHLSKIMYEVNLLHHKFLLNIGKQITAGARLCLAVPTWRGKHEFLHLPMLDHLTDMGYTRVRFTSVDNQDLIYHREGQVVGRELLVLEKR